MFDLSGKVVVTLSTYEKERCEVLTGHKLEDTWLGKDNDETEGHTLDKNENGEYIVLIEKEAEKKALMANA